VVAIAPIGHHQLPSEPQVTGWACGRGVGAQGWGTTGSGITPGGHGIPPGGVDAQSTLSSGSPGCPILRGRR